MIRCKEIQGKIFEAQKDDQGRVSYPVTIISQGLGNLADKNYYSKEAIESGVEAYEGKKCYFDHPTAKEENERPGRSVRELVGHYENVHVENDDRGLPALKGFLVPIKNNDAAIGLIEHAIEYKKKYGDQNFIGISINGDGEGEEMSYEEFLEAAKPSGDEMEKIKKIEGQRVMMITKLRPGFSADLVTEPGARGGLLTEFNKKIKNIRRTKMFEALKKLFLGAENNDRKLIESALKSLHEDGEKKEDEDEGFGKQVEAFHKEMKSIKQSEKKKEDESEDEFEKRMIGEALKKMKKEDEKKEDEKKEDDKKADGDKDEDKDGEKCEKKEGEDEDEAKKEAKKDDGEKDGKDHPDKDEDVTLIKKMMGEFAELKKEMYEMMGKKEDESKKSKESEASASVKLKVIEREKTIDDVLGASGLGRALTKEIRPALEKCKTKEEMIKLVEAMKKVATQAREAWFFNSPTHFGETIPQGENENNDKFFKGE